MGVTRPFVFGTFKLYEGRDAYNLQGADVLNYFAEIPLDYGSGLLWLVCPEFAELLRTGESGGPQSSFCFCYQSLRALLKAGSAGSAGAGCI